MHPLPTTLARIRREKLVAPSTVSGWKARGVYPAWVMALEDAWTTIDEQRDDIAAMCRTINVINRS